MRTYIHSTVQIRRDPCLVKKFYISIYTIVNSRIEYNEKANTTLVIYNKVPKLYN